MPKPQDLTCSKAGYRLLTSLLMATMLTACGYKGPLYMPPPAPDESLTTPPTSTTLPAPEAGGQSGEPSSAATPSPVQ